MHAAACLSALRVMLVVGAEGPELGALFPRLSATISTSDHGPLRFWGCGPPFPLLHPTSRPSAPPYPASQGGQPVGLPGRGTCGPGPTVGATLGRTGAPRNALGAMHETLTTIVLICCEFYSKL